MDETFKKIMVKIKKRHADKHIDIFSIPVFGDLARNTIDEGRTYLTVDRLYTIWQSLNQIKNGSVCEVGVFKGGSAKFILESLNLLNKNNPVFLFDTFKGHIEVNPDIDGWHKVGSFSPSLPNCQDASFESVKKYLDGYENFKIFMGDFRETCEVIENGVFCFVHVDVDVYSITRYCLDFFKKGLCVGGMLVVDDYGFITCRGAKLAVDEFMLLNSDCFRFFHLVSGQGLLVKVKTKQIVTGSR